MRPSKEPSALPGEQDSPAIHAGAPYFTDLERRLAPYFVRAEPRQRALAYLRGLLSSAERKNSWQLAEVSGDTTPYGLQHLLRRALWDADAVRDALHIYLMDHLQAPEAVLAIDETSVLKKGRYSAGVARQYSSTTGRIENCQVGVFLVYASRHGRALLDRELYLPHEWTNDSARCRRAGIPEERRYMTKPALAQQMLERAFTAGTPAKWVTGGSSYGADRQFRLWLETQLQAYALMVSGQDYVRLGYQQRRVNTLLASLPAEGWMRLSAGDGDEDPPWYDWCWLPLANPSHPQWRRWLLVQRSCHDPKDLAAYVVCAPLDTTRQEVVNVVATCWTSENTLAAAKRDVGLDDYEVRSWTGWYRHITLAMWAYALLTVLRTEATAVEAVTTSLLPPQTESSLAAFKASRGLKSR